MKTVLRFPFFTLLLLALGRLTAVAQSAGKGLTLTEALALNRQNAPAIQSRQRLLQCRAFEVAEARLAYLPRVIAQTQALYATTNQVRGAFFPNAGTAISLEGGIRPNGANGQLANGSPMIWSSFTTLLADWPLYNFGRTRAQVAVAQADRAREQANVVNTTFQQQVETADAYLTLLSTGQIRRAEEANLQRLTALQTIVLARTRSGLQAGVDSALAQPGFGQSPATTPERPAARRSLTEDDELLATALTCLLREVTVKLSQKQVLIEQHQRELFRLMGNRSVAFSDTAYPPVFREKSRFRRAKRSGRFSAEYNEWRNRFALLHRLTEIDSSAALNRKSFGLMHWEFTNGLLTADELVSQLVNRYRLTDAQMRTQSDLHVAATELLSYAQKAVR